MEEHVKSPNTAPPPASVGEQLRAAREAQGLSLGDIAAQTRVAERHLISIEEDRFAELAAPTYAVGFSRSYARAVGLNEGDIVARVRRQLNAQPASRAPTLPSFEPGDPARVPPSRIAWLAGLLAVVVVGVLLFTWNDFISPEEELPALVPDAKPSPAPMVQGRPAPSPVVPGGPVVLTATAPRVWVKVTDGAGAQLFQKELGQGERYTVPTEAQNPQLRTARPDQLQITVGGRAIAPLGDKPEVISGVMLTPAALLQRAGPAPAGAAPGAASPPASASTARVPPRAAGAQRPDVPPLPKMDDLLQGAEAGPPTPGNPVSTTQQ